MTPDAEPSEDRLADLRPASTAIAAGRPDRLPGAPLNTPIIAASSFHAGGKHSYARESQPTWESFEQVIGALEGGTAVSFSSGMGAIAACLDLLPIGAVVVAPTHAYSGTLARLADLEHRGAVQVRRVAMDDAAQVASAVGGATALWLESPTNPLLEICDIAPAAAAAHAAGVTVFCDNTFATPIGQRPLELGVDVVVHSATKSIGGHSDLLLGIAVATDDEMVTKLRMARALVGATPGMLEAFLALRGVRTLPLRMRQAQRSALELAARLASHPDIVKVRYPGLPTDPGHAVAARQMTGFGAIVAIEPTGDADRAERLCAATRLWTHATSLGGVESTLERRARWAAEQADVPRNLIRLSVGCEDVDDLWADLARALPLSR
jgi:cystathionine gamma-synthase